MSEERKFDVTARVMGQIEDRRLCPRPRWYFVVGAGLWGFGLGMLLLFLAMLLHRMIFLSADPGPLLSGMPREWKLIFFLIGTPVAVASFMMGTRMCRRFGMFYRHHPYVLYAGIASVVFMLAAVVEFTPLCNYLF